MADLLRQIVARNRAGEAIAIPSVCSAHPDVLRASMARAAQLDQLIVIEATSNQVNQDGGYTGMKAGGFIKLVHNLAEQAGLDRQQLIFGGDHLGPQAWRDLPADAAMAKAHRLVSDYVGAGFSKIHLDCSEGCLGEPATLRDEVTAARSAQLARTCIEAAGTGENLAFVIGTEVPPPGGARTDQAGDIPATRTVDAMHTLAAHKAAFEAEGIGEAFANVVGLVVQPGVEFTPMHVHHYPVERALGFRTALMDWPGICLEAHSTDYQKPQVYHQLATEGFAFQKVGPALTFAWRKAIYAFDQLRALYEHREAQLMLVMEDIMLAAPSYWQGHYSGDAQQLFVARHFGLADRIRYYWPDNKAQVALGALRSWLDTHKLPEPLLLQVFSRRVLDRAESLSGSWFDNLISAEVQVALDPYFLDATDPKVDKE